MVPQAGHRRFGPERANWYATAGFRRLANAILSVTTWRFPSNRESDRGRQPRGPELAADPQFSPDLLEAPQVLRVDEPGESGVVIKVPGATRRMRHCDVTGELRRRTHGRSTKVCPRSPKVAGRSHPVIT